MQTINISYLHFWLHSINQKLKSKQQTSFSNRHRFRFAVVSPYFKVLCRRLKSFPLRIVLMFHSRDVTVRLPSFTDRLVYIGLTYVDLYSQEYQWTVTRKEALPPWRGSVLMNGRLRILFHPGLLLPPLPPLLPFPLAGHVCGVLKKWVTTT